MANQNNVLRGSAAGAAGGLIGAVVMGWFMTGPGNEIEGAIDRVVGKPVGPTPHGANAALMVADAFVGVAGKRLTSKQREKTPQAVHLIFSVIMGGIYGGLVERAPSASGGAGTGFGSALFVAAGLPALKLGQGADELKPGELASSYAAHLVYGATTELGRRLTRAGL